ncbi:MAG: alpha-amylase [Cyanothece sp. SIO2G6]|nr:alpha-amylase [Cyanothece sp. SIO2G6]
MRYFEEYCEVHLESGSAPLQWVFQSCEPVRIKFGVALSSHPDYGQVLLTAQNGKGSCEIKRLDAQTIGITKDSFKLFVLTLPLAPNGTSYKYQLGYQDQSGKEHTSSQSRYVMICDEAPHSMNDIDINFLTVFDGRPLYGPDPQIPITSGPQTWANRLFYSLIIDRFAKGDNEDRHGLGMVHYDLGSPHASHGGTLQGIREKLPYLKALGVGALIISPVYVNESSGYHGYHPVHLLMVEPRIGTLQILQALVAEAHSLDIAIVLDVVVNHLADSIDWEEYGGPPGGEFKYIQGDDTAVLPFPVESRSTLLFHGPEYTDMINQRLFGFLEDWRTESTYVRTLLTNHLKYWLAVTDVDGFRYDSARHVGIDFWQPCIEEISRYATYLGKTDFLQIAEHAGSQHEELTAYNDANFSGFLDYPTHYVLKHSLDDGTWMGGYADYFCGFLAPTSSYAAGWRNNLMFLDNQDTSRILHEFLSRHVERPKATRCLHFALGCAILGPQRPTLYAGTEQEFSGALGIHQREDTGEWIGHDCHVREDMFDNPACTWKFGPINRKVFQPYNQDHETFSLIRELAAIRQHQSLVVEGDRTVLLQRESGFRCVLLHDAKETPPLLVVMNLGTAYLTETEIPIPESYGRIDGLDFLVATSGGVLEWVDRQLHAQLPPFAFIMGQLLIAPPASQISPSHTIGECQVQPQTVSALQGHTLRDHIS